jgi:hypothetical protein
MAAAVGRHALLKVDLAVPVLVDLLDQGGQLGGRDRRPQRLHRDAELLLVDAAAAIRVELSEDLAQDLDLLLGQLLLLALARHARAQRPTA